MKQRPYHVKQTQSGHSPFPGTSLSLQSLRQAGYWLRDQPLTAEPEAGRVLAKRSGCVASEWIGMTENLPSYQRQKPLTTYEGVTYWQSPEKLAEFLIHQIKQCEYSTALLQRDETQHQQQHKKHRQLPEPNFPSCIQSFIHVAGHSIKQY